MKVRLRCLLLCLIIVLSACGQKAPTWQEQYDLGIRYLSEGNYEEAIIAFTAAIQIDPKQAEAYLGAADAYLGLDDEENVIAVLRRGLEALGDNQEITNRLAELENADVPTDTPAPGTEDLPSAEKKKEESPIVALMREGNDGNLLRYDDITFLGQDPNGVTMNAVESLLKQHGYYTKVDEASNVDDIVGGSLHFVSDDGFESVLGNMIRISSDDGSKISNLFYSNVGEEESLLDIGIRGICLSDSLETALSKLGFSNAVEIASWVYTHEFASIEEELATDSWYYRSNNGPVYIYWRADRADSPDSHDVLELSVAVQPDDAWLDYEAWIQRQGYLGYSDRRITLRFLWNGGLKTAFVYP